MLLSAEIAEQIIARELAWVMPVLKSITLDASTMTGTHDTHLTIHYNGKRVRYQVIHADYNADRTEVIFQLRLERILNEGNPE
jgi:hypothetical protein